MDKVKIIIEADSPKDLLKYLKAEDMASFIFELVHNGWREFKHTDYDYHIAWEKINTLLDEHNINIDEIIQ